MSEVTQFGPFELVRRLGRGGMAETFEAIRHGASGVSQRVCIKRILPAFERDTEFLRLFLEEARVSASLHHGGIAQVLDFGEVEGSHYLALELVEGLDLRTVISRLVELDDRLTTGVVAHLAFELAGALEYAHAATPSGRARGVVHRDISPSNVLLSREGEVKLTDFGIAKAMSADVATRTAAVKGKLPYMAPEYASAGHFNAQSDLFSLGVTLYECVRGRRPFDGANDLETLENLQRGRYARLSEAVPSVDRAFAAAVERLLEPDPERRYRTASEFLDELVALSPPGTAQLILGRVVGALADHVDSDLSTTHEALAHTRLRETELDQGTLLLADDSAPRDPVVVSAAPHEPTRTRLPTVLAESAAAPHARPPQVAAPSPDAGIATRPGRVKAPPSE
ncbi:MAG: serine/threonine protein kinase [Sandaracinaceae bacterium]|nr:serine/threonine protein kinase [Myxococcales bacterium]MCB9661270.1 serine/threonine protein kinase [Sandaracinaceae bacterium]